jgi:WD40 repeat protein
LRHNAKIKGAVFSPDGQMVVTAGWDQEVRRWAVRTGTAIGDAFRHEGIVYTVAIAGDGRTILSGSDDRTARLWDVRTGLALAPPLQHADGVFASALSTGGRFAVTMRDDGVAQLWDVASGKPMARPLQFELSNDGKALMVTDAVFSPDDSVILFRCSDGTARLYDVPRPLPDKPELIRVWARARSGYRIDRQSSPRQLTQGEWLEAQQKLIALESQ